MRGNEVLIRKRYEFMDHTADVKFRAYGTTLTEAFANGAVALFSIITDVEKVRHKIGKDIAINSQNKESLLFDFFEEMIYLIDTEGFLLGKVKKISITKEDDMFKLYAKIYGDDAEHYETHSQLKAMTYHELIVKDEPGFAMIQVVPDI